MQTLITSTRVARDQDTLVEMRTEMQFFVENILIAEEFDNHDRFFKTNKPLTHVKFMCGREVILMEPFAKIAKLRRQVQIAHACGRLPLVNVQ